MKPKIELRKLRDFGDIINDTFVFIGQNWKSLLKAYAVICGFFVIASLAVAILNSVKTAENMGAISPNSFSTPFQRMFTTEYFLSMAFLFITYSSISLTGVVFVALYVDKGNQPPTAEEVWTYFKFYFFRVIFSTLLLSIGLIFAFALCLLPGFYLWPAFSLIVPVIVIENTSLGFAFNRSFELIKGNFWTVLGAIIVTLIIVGVGVAILSLPVTFFTTFTLLFSGHKLTSTSLILNVIANHICLVFYMLPSITTCLIYYSLTEQKDGTGLLARINNLGKPDSIDDAERSDEQY